MQTVQTPISNSTDDASIRALYQQLIDGWNQGIGEAFAEDADLVGFDSTHLRGRRRLLPFTSGYLILMLKAVIW